MKVLVDSIPLFQQFLSLFSWTVTQKQNNVLPHSESWMVVNWELLPMCNGGPSSIIGLTLIYLCMFKTSVRCRNASTFRAASLPLVPCDVMAIIPKNYQGKHFWWQVFKCQFMTKVRLKNRFCSILWRPWNTKQASLKDNWKVLLKVQFWGTKRSSLSLGLI